MARDPKTDSTETTGTTETTETTGTPVEPRAPRRRGRVAAVVAVALAVVLVVIAAGVVVATALSRNDGADDPVRVLLVGDSIMNQAGVHLEEELESRAVETDVEVHNQGQNGSGLLTPQLYDWQDVTPDLLEEIEPDVVVVLFVGNYTSTELYVNQAGLSVLGYTDQFFEAWEREARDLQAQLVESGADVYWVNPPPMLREEGELRVDEFRGIHRRIAEDWTGTVLIDGTEALSADDGEYAWELPDEEGRLEQVRTLDSVHLTQHGAQLLAEEIGRQVAPSVIVVERDRQNR